MCAFCEESDFCPRHGSYNLVDVEDGPETVWEQLAEAANVGNQPAEFVGVAR